MRFMDGLMAIPAILLAIALVSLSRAGLAAVVVAIVVPEVPRVVRLVRSVVLSIREEPYVEAAIAVGTRTPQLLVRHVLPNTVAPLIVQATYIAASAILIEAILSFLGVGIPPETPTWGNIMAEGRSLFRVFPHIILLPGHLPRAHRARGQHAGRRAARHARSADGDDASDACSPSRGLDGRPAARRGARRTPCGASTSRWTRARSCASSANRARARA